MNLSWRITLSFMAVVLVASHVVEACTSFRLKTEDGQVF